MSATRMRKKADRFSALAEIEEKLKRDTGYDGSVALNRDHHSGVDFYTYQSGFLGTGVNVSIGNEISGVKDYAPILAEVKAELAKAKAKLKPLTENDIKVLEEMGYTVTEV